MGAVEEVCFERAEARIPEPINGQAMTDRDVRIATFEARLKGPHPVGPPASPIR